MTDVGIVYIGNDSTLKKALHASAESLQTKFYEYSIAENDNKPFSNSGLLIFLDDFSNKSVECVKKIGDPSTLTLSIFIGQPENRDLPDLPTNNLYLFDEIICNTSRQELIDKHVEFYLTHLQARLLAPSNFDQHEAIKKNKNLTRQIVNLQDQLSQFNTDLQTQEEILDKIDQISQLSRQINCLDRKKIALVCIEKIPELISARFASLYTYNEKEGTLTLLHHNHPYNIDKKVDLTQYPDSPMSIAIQQKKMLLIKDFTSWEESNDVNMTRMFTRNYKSNSCIIAPLKSGDEIFGLLNLADKISDQCFNPNKDLPPIELLCEIIGSAMSNIKLYDKVRTQARTDGMTGLVNHSTFYNELDKEVIRSKRYGNNLSLIMIDLDRLKEANDLLGHRAGDAMIINITEQIRYCIRETDIAARYGGDEFSIILPNTSLSDALIVAQRLLDRVANNSIKVEGKTLQPSVSIGLSQFQTNFTTKDFMREADIALLDAKNSGKNCIHISETVKQ
jgi:diguanylate cyclase (GGDEF)-like protein